MKKWLQAGAVGKKPILVFTPGRTRDTGNLKDRNALRYFQLFRPLGTREAVTIVAFRNEPLSVVSDRVASDQACGVFELAAEEFAVAG